MSQFRHRWKVTMDGGNVIEVATTARDMAAVKMEMGPDGATLDMTGILCMVHAAAARKQMAGIPPRLEDFLDLVDELEGVEEGSNQAVDPTRLTALGGSP